MRAKCILKAENITQADFWRGLRFEIFDKHKIRKFPKTKYLQKNQGYHKRCVDFFFEFEENDRMPTKIISLSCNVLEKSRLCKVELRAPSSSIIILKIITI